MENWKVLKCHDCDTEELYYEYNDSKTEEKKCEHCNDIRSTIQYHNIDKADFILEIIGLELENANWHSVTSVPNDLYNEITKGNNDAELARKIAKVFYNAIW